jgi:hypothetical protein
LPVVRLYELHDEAYYVVRRADGRPLAVPVWMTRPEAAYAKAVSTARLPVRVLLELRSVVVTCLSLSLHNVPEEDHDAADPSKTPTADVRRSSRHSRCAIPIGRARAVAPAKSIVVYVCAHAIGTNARLIIHTTKNRNNLIIGLPPSFRLIVHVFPQKGTEAEWPGSRKHKIIVSFSVRGGTYGCL